MRHARVLVSLGLFYASSLCAATFTIVNTGTDPTGTSALPNGNGGVFALFANTRGQMAVFIVKTFKLQ